MKEAKERALEAAKRVLESEFAEYPYVVNDGLRGHGVTYRKVCDYIFSSIDAHVEQSACKNWLTDLVTKYKMPKQEILDAELMVDVAYRYAEYLRTKQK